jgi:hypothetical protein
MRENDITRLYEKKGIEHLRCAEVLENAASCHAEEFRRPRKSKWRASGDSRGEFFSRPWSEAGGNVGFPARKQVFVSWSRRPGPTRRGCSNLLAGQGFA